MLGIVPTFTVLASRSIPLIAHEGFAPFSCSGPPPAVGQLLDVVHHAVQPPLRDRLLPAAQVQPREPLVVPQVGEHRLHRADALAVQAPSVHRVDGPLHALHGMLYIDSLWLEPGNLSPPTVLRALQALPTQVAALAIGVLRVVDLVAQPAGRGVPGAEAGQRLPGRAGAGVVTMEVEVLGPEALDLVRWPLVRQRVLGLVPVPVCEAFVALAHLVVGHQRRDALLHELTHVGIVVVAGIGGDQGVGLPIARCLLDHGQQHGLFGA